LGGSLLSPERFLYEMQGLVYLMEWNRARGTAVKVVAGGAADAALALGPALAADVLARKPMLAAQVRVFVYCYCGATSLPHCVAPGPERGHVGYQFDVLHG